MYKRIPLNRLALQSPQSLLASRNAPDALLLVGQAGVEPACSLEREILSLLCLPFHHCPLLLS